MDIILFGVSVCALHHGSSIKYCFTYMSVHTASALCTQCVRHMPSLAGRQVRYMHITYILPDHSSAWRLRLLPPACKTLRTVSGDNEPAHACTGVQPA